MMNFPSRRAPRAPEIESLADLDSREHVRAALTALAARYRKVGIVSPLPELPTLHTHDCQFLVEFDRTQDALAASSDWRCPMFGLSAVIVSLTGSCCGG